MRLKTLERVLDDPSVLFARRALAVLIGIGLLVLSAVLAVSLATWTVSDPSLTHATDGPVRNIMGSFGAAFADPVMQLFGLAAPLLILPLPMWGLRLLTARPVGLTASRIGAGFAALFLAPGFVDAFPVTDAWPLPLGLGGVVGSVWDAVIVGGLGIVWGWLQGIVSGLLGLAAGAALVIALRPARRREAPADLGFQFYRREVADEYGLDGTDTFETEASRFAEIHGALVHRAMLLRARMRSWTAGAGAMRTHREPPSLKAALAGTPEVEADVDIYRPRGEGRSPSPRAPQPADEVRRMRPVRTVRVAVAPEDEPERGSLTFKTPLRGPAARVRRSEVDLVAPRDEDDGWDGDETWDEDALRDADAADEDAIDHEAYEEDHRFAAASGVEDDERLDEDAHGDEFEDDEFDEEDLADDEPPHGRADEPAPRVIPAAGAMKPGRRVAQEAQPSLLPRGEYEFPPLSLLTSPPADRADRELTEDALEANARVLEGVLDDFGVKGQIINVRPGPVVTLYELEPAPGIKSSRVIGLADDIARSMSAISARVAVIPGKNAIGIELPNPRRVTVFLRELLASEDFERTKQKLPMCLGKTIGGEAVIADLARMPHLLVAGTTGSGKSVSINTMILSLLYHHRPEACRIILIDPKMLELSVYDGIPHLLTPVVTDAKKAVTSLRWAVREMEDRYRKMAKLGVRNIEGYNQRLREAERSGEPLTRIVQTGFDRGTGQAIFEEEHLELEAMPFIVVIVDEMADLMMVAGKDIEGAIQRLAQMARAAGIHLIMATQRPSVDVITGTIKANFPTRISFQVTSKIDSRTILGEMGAEQLLGMGDMLFMAGGGRIQRVHGPFVSDEEVEDVVAHLKRQGAPEYLTAVLEDDEDDEPAGEAPGLDALAESDDLYDRAVALVLRDRKASTSYVQRRLAIGYNRAATLIERMEREGVVSPANHAGKRDILVPGEEEAA
ncbi:DNA translocase FtsK [Acuticoccus sp.]|uniref:DNA translocase FtsK n=1 Tax=Acuticoccus sp. TaxID=1904378 RepID=UPI003B523018